MAVHIMKESGLRIRVENDLREMFLAVCKKEDQTAAQVLRAFMRSYIEQRTGATQPDLFQDSLNINMTKYGEQK
jgi:antitoxin component of RelBE/YafQ-DinJ toxin-antitoxin module